MSEKGSGNVNVQLPRDAVERAVAQVKFKPVVMGAGSAPSHGQVVRLRDRHHQIARFVAQDVDPERICKVMGMTRSRLDMLVDQTPAFQELISYYRSKNIPAKHAATEEYIDLLERNMIAAELEIADRLAEDPAKFSVSELHKVARDSADRLGFSKHSVNLNVNVTLKEKLEGLRRRARGAPAGAGSGGGGDVATVARPASPPLLELKANSVQALQNVATDAKPGGPVGSSASNPIPPASDPDAPMTREQVLAAHREALTRRTHYPRVLPAPVKEPMKRRI